MAERSGRQLHVPERELRYRTTPTPWLLPLLAALEAPERQHDEEAQDEPPEPEEG